MRILKAAFPRGGGDVLGPESPLAPHASVPRDLSPWSLGLIWTQVTESHVNNEEGVGGGQSVSVPPPPPPGSVSLSLLGSMAALWGGE